MWQDTAFHKMEIAPIVSVPCSHASAKHRVSILCARSSNRQWHTKSVESIKILTIDTFEIFLWRVTFPQITGLFLVQSCCGGRIAFSYWIQWEILKGSQPYFWGCTPSHILNWLPTKSSPIPCSMAVAKGMALKRTALPTKSRVLIWISDIAELYISVALLGKQL